MLGFRASARQNRSCAAGTYMYGRGGPATCHLPAVFAAAGSRPAPCPSLSWPQPTSSTREGQRPKARWRLLAVLFGKPPGPWGPNRANEAPPASRGPARIRSTLRAARSSRSVRNSITKKQTQTAGLATAGATSSKPVGLAAVTRYVVTDPSARRRGVRTLPRRGTIVVANAPGQRDETATLRPYTANVLRSALALRAESLGGR